MAVGDAVGNIFSMGDFLSFFFIRPFWSNGSPNWIGIIAVGAFLVWVIFFRGRESGSGFSSGGGGEFSGGGRF